MHASSDDIADHFFGVTALLSVQVLAAGPEAWAVVRGAGILSCNGMLM